MLTTTLNRIREHRPCKEGWEKLLKHLGKTQGDDEILPYTVILDSNGLDDALWCCRAEPQYSREWRLCAEQVQPLMKDERSLDAIDVARKFAEGEATQEELNAAWDAAWDAVRDAAWNAAWNAAWDAVMDAARDAVMDAAWDAAWDAVRDVQAKHFIKICSEE